MFHLSTIRRRLLLGAGFVVVLSGLSLMVVHTGLVRRFALVQLQARLGNTLGLVIDAKELDYNLLASRFELKDLAIRGIQLKDMPPPVRAHRIVAVIPLWGLVRGSFDRARIRIEGLSVEWVIAAGGRTNWPSIELGGGGGKPGGPSVLVDRASLVVRDHRSGYRLQLPIPRMSAEWDSSRSVYGIHLDAAGGEVRLGSSRVPLDNLQLRSAIGNGGFTLDSLRVASGASRADLSGVLSGSPARIDASANLDVDLLGVTQALAPALAARGHILAAVSASGRIDALQIAATLKSDEIAAGTLPVRRLAAVMLFDAATGELQIRDLSAGVLYGQFRGRGSLSTGGRGRSEFTATLSDASVGRAAAMLGVPGAPDPRGSVSLRASGPGLDWRRASLLGTAQIRSAKLEFNASTRGDSVRALLDSSLGESGSFHGDLGYRFGDGSLTGTVAGKVESLAGFAGELERLLDRPGGSLIGTQVDAAAAFSATLGGTHRHPSATVALQANGIAVGGWTGGALELRAAYAGDRIAIENAHLSWAGQQVDIRGELGGFSSDAPLQLEGTLQGPSLAGVFDHLGKPRVADASVSGELRVSGTVGQPVADATLRADRLTAFGQPFSSAGLDARWQGGQVTLGRLTAEQLNGSGTPGRIEANGCLTVATGQYEIDASALDVQPAGVTLPGDLPLSGTFRFEAHGKGTFDDPVLKAVISGTNVAAGETALGEVRADLDAAGHRATAFLSIPALNVKASSTIGLAGTWPFDLSLDAANTRLKTASFDAAVRASGTLADARVERATAGIRNLRVAAGREEILSDGPIELSYADGTVQVAQLSLKSGNSTLAVSGQLPVQEEAWNSGTLSVKGTLDLAPLSQLLPASDDPRIGGTVDVNASIAGSVQNWQPGGSLTIRNGLIRSKALPFPLESVAGRVNLDNGFLRLDQVTGKAGTGDLRIDGSAPLPLISNALPAPPEAAGQPARFSAQLSKLAFSGGGGERSASVTFDAKVEGEASALSLDALRATVDLSNIEARGPENNLRQASPARIALSGSVARLEGLELRGTNSSLKVAGSLGLTGPLPLDLNLAGGMDLAALSALSPAFDLAGALKMDLRVGGTAADPRAKGFVEVDHASLVLKDPPIQARNVKFRADLDGNQVKVAELNGNLNGGTFQGGGEAIVGTAGIRDVNLFLKAKDMFADYPPSVKTTSSVDAKLVSRQGRMVLEGRIEVQEGYTGSPLDLFSKSNVDTGPEVVPDSRGNPVALDLKIVTKRPVEMDNNLGRVSATADLRVAGSTAQPRLLGALQLEEDGRLYFGDRTYYIDRGTVRFLDAPRITPELNIRAYTRTGDYTIWLGLTGQLNEITTTFTSDPPLSRDDVIAVLLTGKTVAENRGVDLRALEATSLATGALNASLSSQLHRTIGVSRVSIQPGAIAAESNPGARVTVTQDFTRSLRLLYSMNLSDSNDQIWIGEYDLSRHFTTRAVKQEDNTYRGEFRHDVRFGSSSPAQAPAATPAATQRISALHFTGTGPFTAEELAKIFKVKAGQQYKPVKVRNGSDRVAKFLADRGYLEARVRLDRQDSSQGLDLTVRIDLGPTVQLAFQGADLPGKQKSRVRNIWRSGISDQQRPEAARGALLGYFAEHGYLRAKVIHHISGDEERKLVRFDLEPGLRYSGVRIVVEGAGRQRAADILSLVSQPQLRDSVYRDPARAIEAITAFYRQRGYLAAKVAPPVHHLDSERRTGRIVIAVEEGPAYRVGALRFSGNQSIPGADLESGLPLETGAVFEPGRVEPSISALKLKYGKLGYREADIDYRIVRHDESAQVDLAFTIVENQQTSIGAIKVEGNRHTSEKFARNQLRVSEGQVASTELVRQSVRNLSQTGAYSTADIQVIPVEESLNRERTIKIADLVVGVAEPKPFRLLYGGLYDSGGGPGFIADIQNHNSFGAGRVLGLRTRVDPETDELRLYLTQPTWRSRRISTTLATYYTRETLEYQTVPTEKLGFSLQQDVQLPSRMLFSYGYRYEKQRGFVPDPAAPDIPEEIVSVAPVTVTISRDARDSVLDATRGSFVSHGFELAPHFLGSDYPYLRYYFQYFKYFPLTRPRPVPFGEKPLRSRLVFATGSRVGVQKGFNSTGAVLTDRFYAGGGTTVRGFRQDELGPRLANGQPAGGNAVLVLNEELRYPVYWIFDAVTFIDIGNVFPRVTDFRVSDLRAAYGFGLRIRNPFVVLRFDYGFKFDRRPGESRGAFFFSIGQAF